MNRYYHELKNTTITSELIRVSKTKGQNQVLKYATLTKVVDILRVYALTQPTDRTLRFNNLQTFEFNVN